MRYLLFFGLFMQLATANAQEHKMPAPPNVMVMQMMHFSISGDSWRELGLQKVINRLPSSFWDVGASYTDTLHWYPELDRLIEKEPESTTARMLFFMRDLNQLLLAYEALKYNKLSTVAEREQAEQTVYLLKTKYALP